MALTETWLAKSAKPQDKLYKKSDGDGLEIVIYPSGVKSWRYRFTLDGKQQNPYTIGRYPDLSLLEAREIRAELAKLVAKGINPTQKRKQDKQKRPTLTIEEYGSEYYQEVVCRDRKNPEHILRYLTNDIYPKIGTIPVSKLTIEDVRRIVETKKVDSPASAGQIRDLIKRLYDHAIAKGIADANPAAAIPKRFITKDRPRDRVLSQPEIKHFLSVIYGSNIRRQFKLSFHLLLLTLVRKGELLKARWEHIDWQAGEWHIPQENSKTGKPHIIFLSTQAANLFRELESLASGSEFVLPGRSSIKKPFADNAFNTALSGLSFNMPPFVVHDLRRTVATHLHEMGHPFEVVEKALNHQIRSTVAATYNRAEYASQRKAMLQQWADLIESIVTEQKVIFGQFANKG